MTLGTSRAVARKAAFAMLLALGFATISTVAHAQDADAVAPPTGQQLAAAKCVSGMEKFLPGEYFYCLAAKSYGQDEPRYADKFFKEAAAWGSKPAEYVLGVMALNGDGQAVNRPLALAWFALASERHTPRFQQPYDDLRQQLDPDDLGKAAAYLSSLKKTYGDDVAAARAEERYRSGMKQLAPSGSDGIYCMQGMHDYRSDDSADAGGAGGATTRGCGTLVQVERYVDNQAADLFEDWKGHVTVGTITVATGKPKASP